MLPEKDHEGNSTRSGGKFILKCNDFKTIIHQHKSTRHQVLKRDKNRQIKVCHNNHDTTHKWKGITEQKIKNYNYAT